jgi:beta-glucosidase
MKKLVTTFLIILTFISLAYSQYDTPVPVRTDFKWPEGKKMALSFTFDDARLTQVDNGIPIFDKYNVKATFYVSMGSVMKRLDGWKKAIKTGHEIGNHSLLHSCTINYGFSRVPLEEYTLSRMERELDSAGREIKRVLGVDAVSFAYPCGQTYVGKGTSAKSFVPLISAMFESGRNWLGENSNNPWQCDFAQLQGMELDGKTFDQVLQLIDAAKKDGKWLILAGHEINVDGRQTSRMDVIEALCKYASDPANGVWIDNVHNVAAYVKKQRGEPEFSRLPRYMNPTVTINERVQDLLSRMTLEEKIGQINMPCVYINRLGKDVKAKMEGVKKFTEGTMEKGVGPGGGFFTLPNNILFEGAKQQAEFNNELQKIALEKTRLKIPLLMTEEGTHGLMCSGATIFPEGLAIGSTWNMDLVKDIYTVAAREARGIGIHEIFTLVIEPNRDPRLGRNEEGYSEDPFLCARIAESIVAGAQGNDVSAPDKVVAGLCHYPGQSQPFAGLERGSMEISERKLREVFLPPWEAGIKKMGALGVMATYPDIDGITNHGNEKTLTKILREELGFDGLVLSEGGGIGTLMYERMAPGRKEAGALSLKAGVDVGISYEEGYMDLMAENVNDGSVSMATIDRAVERILTQKMRLGLFENPYVDPAHAVNVSHTKEAQDLALQVEREGIVLLKNEKNILPLKKDVRSIAVIGPDADETKEQLGDYTSKVVLQDVTTILEGIKAKVSPKTTVTYVKGCNVSDNKLNEIDKAVKAAKSAQIAVLVLGENGDKTNGEGHDAATLELTGLQQQLLEAVYNTGTPVVLVLVNGRALAIRWAAEKVPGIVEAWMCGEKGGDAVADVLFGDYNPSGRLPVTFPRHAGQLPVFYNSNPSKEYWIEHGWGNPYVDMDPTPLYEFGFGLSYTTFEYSNLQISPEVNGREGEFVVKADISNTGSRQGAEVAQLYINDEISSVIRPVKELKGFKKVMLNPGEKKTVEFRLTPEELSLFDKDLNKVVEPGKFTVMIGSSSKNIKLKGEIEVK